MINLLPPEERQELLLEKKNKIVIILGIILLIPLVCSILFLLSIKFYILGEATNQQLALSFAEQKYQTADFLNFKNTIQKDDAVLKELQSFYENERYVSDALKVIASVNRPPDLYLTNLALTKATDGNFQIITEGFSGSRANLLIFQQNLQNDSAIQNPDFSPESWVNPQNVDFSLTFEVSQ